MRTLTRIETYELAWCRADAELAKKSWLSDRGLANLHAGQYGIPRSFRRRTVVRRRADVQT
jgi:hypothetical protein